MVLKRQIMNNKNIRKLFSSLRFIPFSKILLDEDTFNHTLMNFNEDYDTLSKWEEFQDRFYKEFCGFLSFETHIKNYFNNIKKIVYDNLLIEEREEINNKNIEFLKNKRDDLVEGKSYLSIDLSKAYDLSAFLALSFVVFFSTSASQSSPSPVAMH